MDSTCDGNIVLPVEELAVSSKGGKTPTVMDCSTLPTASVIVTGSWEFTVRSRSAYDLVTNPSREALTVYVPGCNPTTPKLPSASVVVLISTPTALARTVTSAPAIGNPCWSATNPWIEEVTCACKKEISPGSKMKIARTASVPRNRCAFPGIE
jgi:hypothetical protein